MPSPNSYLQFGDFTIFGYFVDEDISLKQKISSRLGITPRGVDFGPSSSMFFYTTYADVAENDECLAYKLGFFRSAGKSPVTASDMLNTHIVRPGVIEYGQIRGNGLVACLEKKDCAFTVIKTLLGVPQLYYAQVDGGIICSDRLRCIVQLVDGLEINEDIIPLHFLFRSTPGDLTYYRQIRRMLPGELLRWDDDHLSVRLVHDFRFTDSSDHKHRSEDETLETLYNHLAFVVGDHISQIESKGERLANLLSGGVDSSLLQHMINTRSMDPPSRSYSFAVRVPSFKNEIEYARQASRLFQTHHTFVDIQPEDYPGLISRTIEALAQPPILETEPGMLSIAEFIRLRGEKERFFTSGQGADTVFGLTWDIKLKGLHLSAKVPGARWILKTTGTILKPFGNLSQMLLKGGDILACSGNPDAFLCPENSITVYADPEVLRHSFGDGPLLNALRYRRDLAARYLDTDHYLEKVHVIDLMTDTYELGVQRQQLFLENKVEQIHPFFDDDILRAAFAIPADSRYIKGLRPKYLLKEILQRKTGASVARKPKGFSIWEDDLMNWMATGPMSSLVREIELPPFLSRKDFNCLMSNPNYFLWELLTLDLFKRSLCS